VQELGRVLLDHDLALEIQAGREAEVLVGGPGVTIDTTMLAAAIWIDAGLETNVRAVVVGDNALAVIAQELRSEEGLVLFRRVRVGFEMDFLEAVRRVCRSAARGSGGWAGAHDWKIRLSTEKAKPQPKLIDYMSLHEVRRNARVKLGH